ncbi:MAG: amylo-alpha-1,6-glucosidase [Dehalococcoidia bacterium]
MIDECYARAVDLLRRNATDHGFLASSGLDQYRAIWGRDACIAAIGAHLTGEPDLLAAARRSLTTLMSTQAPLGQVAGVHWPQRGYWDWQEAGCTDATAWFVIALWHHFRTTTDGAFLASAWPAVCKAITWLQYQDVNNFGLLDSPQGADWMDATLNRGGKVFYVNCLYYKASLCVGEMAATLGQAPPLDAEAVRDKIGLLFWPQGHRRYVELLSHVPYPTGASANFPHLCSVRAYQAATRPDRRHYLSHVAPGRFVDVFDTLANFLAILWDIADAEKAAHILDYCRDVAISQPYPARVLAEPLMARSDRWGLRQRQAERYQPPRWRSSPYRYHNAGVWPFVGGFYVLALASAGQRQEAQRQLVRLAEANRLGQRPWEFNEWLHGRTGRPCGAPFQTWNAAMYIAAHKAVTSGTVAI